LTHNPASVSDAMGNTELHWLDATEIALGIRNKSLSPVEVTEACIARIEKLNDDLNAFCLPMFDIARDKAKKAEAAQMRGDFWGPLHGVPYAIKDSDDYAGKITSIGSLPHANDVATAHSPIIERMENAGAIPLGKTTTPDMAWMGLTYSLLHGMSHNPWDKTRNPGGSSGGSAIAVATGMAPLATGTDGAGSVRIPASFCGIYGLKPSHGRIPLMLPNMNQHTHYGPLSRTVSDAALMMDVCTGPDDRDLYSLECPSPGYLQHLDKPLKGMRVGWSADLGFVEKIDPEVLSVCEAAAQRFADLGAEVVHADLDLSGSMEIAKRNWQAIMSTIVFHRLGKHVSDLDPALVACARGALEQTSGEFLYDKVQAFPIYQRLVAWFGGHDLLLTPSVACLPVTNGRVLPEDYPEHVWDWMDWAPFSSPFNLFHNPAASIPAGFSSSGLPIGLQIVGPRHADLLVLQASRAFEMAFPWKQHHPPE
jgi:aspartyl-tRNA(Asn)/glutamyl-tRNA(Gln) amidotransferase subunit A